MHENPSRAVWPHLLAGVPLLLTLAGAGCGDDDGGPVTTTDGGTATPDTGPACATGTPDYPLVEPDVSGDSPEFPEGFVWGSSTAPHQVEGGNTASDWWAWEQIDGKIANGDLSDDGPNHWEKYEGDFDLAQSDGMTAYRMGISWSKLFPTRESFDALEPDPDVVQHYHDVFTALAERGMTPMVTLHHFVSPIWMVDPTASTAEKKMMGFASEGIVEDFRRFAEWAGAEYGADVDYWITINEPLVVVLGGFVQGAFPPGLLYDPTDNTLLDAVRNQIFSHAAAYDALKEADIEHADDDGEATRISIAKHYRVMLGEKPCSEVDAAAAEKLDYLQNDLFVNAIVNGDLDANGDGDLDDAEDLEADPDLVGRADFLGVNYYSLSLVNGSIRLSDLITGLPSVEDTRTDLPKNDLHWAIYPGGFRIALDWASGYGLPIYVTENGIADQGEVLRGPFLVDHLHVLAQAIDDGIDVRAYFHWSLMDNFEWAEGYCPRFGLYAVDYDDPERPRAATSGLEVYREIIQQNRVPSALVEANRTYGEPTFCE